MVQQIVTAALTAGWNAADAAIRQPNTTFDPAGNPWIEIRFPGAATRRADIGDADHPMWDEAGAFMCDVYVPVGVGAEMAAALADAMWAIFAGRDLSGVRCDERLQGQSGEREPTGVPGVWWGLSFGVSYRYLSI